MRAQVRLAKNLLRDVLRRWLLGKPASVANIRHLVATADGMAHALRAGDVAAVGMHLTHYWEQKKRMCDAEPARVTAMLDALYARELIYGASLTGAGGGGFMLVVTRRPHAREELASALAGSGAVLHDVAVDSDGLTVSIDKDVE